MILKEVVTSVMPVTMVLVTLRQRMEIHVTTVMEQRSTICVTMEHALVAIVR